MRAEVRADVSEAHRKIATERKTLAERELVKFKFLLEIFTMGQSILDQRKKNLVEAEEPPTEVTLEGLDGALKNLEDLERQAQGAINRHEGAFHAFLAFEETLHQEFMTARSRARGLEVQGERAVKVAESRTGIPPEIVAPEAEAILGPFLGVSPPGNPAKEPMSAPMKKVPTEGSPPA